MTDSTTNRTETRRWARLNVALDDATKPLREDFEWLIGEYSRLREDLAVAHDVIRRLRDGWRPGKNMAVVIARSPRPDPEPIWMSPDRRRDPEPMSDAERMLLDAVAGPNPQPEFEPVDAMPRVMGQPFRCHCGGNVLTRYAPTLYRCNSCGTEYEGTPVAGPDDTPKLDLGGSARCVECDTPHRFGERCAAGPNDTEENR